MLILARLNDGYTMEDCNQVIDNQIIIWLMTRKCEHAIIASVHLISAISSHAQYSVFTIHNAMNALNK